MRFSLLFASSLGLAAALHLARVTDQRRDGEAPKLEKAANDSTPTAPAAPEDAPEGYHIELSQLTAEQPDSDVDGVPSGRINVSKSRRGEGPISLRRPQNHIAARDFYECRSSVSKRKKKKT